MHCQVKYILAQLETPALVEGHITCTDGLLLFNGCWKPDLHTKPALSSEQQQQAQEQFILM